MNFKEQLTKHENILNKYKALYINKDKPKYDNNNNNNISLNKDIILNNINTNNINNYNNIQKNTDFYNKITSVDNILEQQQSINNKKDEQKKEEGNINLEKIDNLLAKLNFKRENNTYNNNQNKKINNLQENKSISLFHEDPNKTQDNLVNTNISISSNKNNNKLDINSIKSKYQNNKINSFNITEKFFNDKKDEKENTNEDNNKLNTINNIKKLNQLNARNEIERIKSKYYNINLNKNNTNNYLNNNYVVNNNIINDSFVQLNKEIIELKAKIDLYRNELIISNQNYIKNSINSKYNKDSEQLININNINKIENHNDNNILDNKETIQLDSISFNNNNYINNNYNNDNYN